jgi:hypothetical protein
VEVDVVLDVVGVKVVDSTVDSDEAPGFALVARSIEPSSPHAATVPSTVQRARAAAIRRRNWREGVMTTQGGVIGREKRPGRACRSAPAPANGRST